MNEKQKTKSSEALDSVGNETLSLISELQSGDEKDFSRLIEIYEPLILHMVSSATERLRDIGGEPDDLRQEAIIALYKAASSYDVEQSEVTFGLYAKICIKNRLISVARRLSRASKAAVAAKKEPVRTATQRRVDIPEELLSHLSEYERSVWRLYLLGASYADMAKRLGKDEKSIENALYRIRAKLKDAIR